LKLLKVRSTKVYRRTCPEGDARLGLVLYIKYRWATYSSYDAGDSPVFEV